MSQQIKHEMKKSVKGTLYALGALVLIAGAILFDKYSKGKSGGSSSSPQASVQTQNIPESSVILKIGGSATIGENLAPSIAKSYMLKMGYSDVQILNSSVNEKSVVGTKNGKKDRIDISAKGTSTGFSALDGNSVDLCMASSQAPAGNSYEEHVIGLDGIAIIVNRNSSIQAMSIPDVRNTFAGNAMKIYRMDENSGTYKVFSELVMNGSTINNSAQKFSSASELVNSVSRDNSGIGFVSYSFSTSGNIKALPVSINSGVPPIIPNALTIQSEKYPLCRRLYFYCSKNNNNQLTHDFLTYAESSEGQRIVNDNGFVNLNISVNNNTDNPIAMPNDPPAYTQLIGRAKKVSTEFRFQTGNSNLDSRGAADITRMVSFMAQPENNAKKVVLVGFTDNVGDPAKNVALSVSRANSVKTILTATGITVKEVKGFGSARPVRGNETPEDKANNRRVEVWLVD